MIVLVKVKVEKGIWLQEVLMFEIVVDEVLIKVLKIVICGMDLYIYFWDEWVQNIILIGFIIGYEYMGYVVKVGFLVKEFKEGDCVISEGYIVCGYC